MVCRNPPLQRHVAEHRLLIGRRSAQNMNELRLRKTRKDLPNQILAGSVRGKLLLTERKSNA
jgi:hypothetical protein